MIALILNQTLLTFRIIEDAEAGVARPTVTDRVTELKIEWREATCGMTKEQKEVFANVGRLKELQNARHTAPASTQLGLFQDTDKTLNSIRQDVSKMFVRARIICTYQLICPVSWKDWKPAQGHNRCCSLFEISVMLSILRSIMKVSRSLPKRTSGADSRST